jgi:hypothetical protein
MSYLLSEPLPPPWPARWRNLSAAASFLTVGLTFAQTVVPPPPLPPASNLVKIEPGLSLAEQMRSVRAHHHKFQNRKDYRRDDSIFGDPSLQSPPLPDASVSPFGPTPPSKP